jgi:hypothetical protein
MVKAQPQGFPRTYVLGSAKSNTGDARDTGQVELLDELPGLLFVTWKGNTTRASRKVASDLASLVLGGAFIILFLDRGGLGVLIWELLDSWVGHAEQSKKC